MTSICLSAIPPRFAALTPVLKSLLAQGAASVILSIPRAYHRFPGPITPPTVPDGVMLLRPETDYGPATKLIAPLKAGIRGEIVICDDDCLYAPGWLAALQSAAEPGVAVTGSGWSVSRLKRVGAAPPYVDIAQGFSGLLIQADILDRSIFDIPQEAFGVDDVWISGHLARARVPIREAPVARARVTPLTLPAGLQSAVLQGRSRARANADCARILHQRSGIWPQR